MTPFRWFIKRIVNSIFIIIFLWLLYWYTIFFIIIDIFLIGDIAINNLLFTSLLSWCWLTVIIITMIRWSNYLVIMNSIFCIVYSDVYSCVICLFTCTLSFYFVIICYVYTFRLIHYVIIKCKRFSFFCHCACRLITFRFSSASIIS